MSARLGAQRQQNCLHSLTHSLLSLYLSSSEEQGWTRERKEERRREGRERKEEEEDQDQPMHPHLKMKVEIFIPISILG
jgi:hypothetical protein